MGEDEFGGKRSSLADATWILGYMWAQKCWEEKSSTQDSTNGKMEDDLLDLVSLDLQKFHCISSELTFTNISGSVFLLNAADESFHLEFTLASFTWKVIAR